MLKNLFRPRHRETLGEPLYALAVAQARKPGFYTDMGVEDRIDARFELYTLHILLLIMRLRDEGDDSGQGGPARAQALFDAYVSALDHTLRELGVGDLSMSKKMRNLGEQLYGRMSSYEPAIRDGDVDTLGKALSRNVLESDDPEAGRALATYALESRRLLAAQGFDKILIAPAWAEVAT